MGAEKEFQSRATTEGVRGQTTQAEVRIDDLFLGIYRPPPSLPSHRSPYPPLYGDPSYLGIDIVIVTRAVDLIVLVVVFGHNSWSGRRTHKLGQ